ncbi:zinc finger CCCH domain-containing protein 65 [Dorcoceras hygrometricum]|uniref:Zinc finger CCCH domain-containing protein 65 n=1 Tax=Dorcoceras hygrometricum TaxID=472368 RepID=A0A2Z7AJS0_9LAMI|nr:zinc finger CCCH domain-containing protein 65 [Dorcoceras hygrometricum]
MSEAAALSFPPHRRRPIRSQTYLNLVQLLSHCHADSSQLNDSSKDGGLRRGCSQSIHSNRGELKSAELLVPNDILVQVTGTDKSIENAGFHDGASNDERTMVLELGCANLATDGEEVVTHPDSMSCGDLLVGGNLPGGSVFQIAKEQKTPDGVDVGSMGQLTVDKEFSIDDFSEVLDSCFGGDMVSEVSKSGYSGKENNSSLEVNTSKEFERVVQLKGMELEKLVSTSAVDEEIEEGEIYVEAGACDLLIDPLSDNATSLGRIAIHTSEENGCKEDFTCNSKDQIFPRHCAYMDKEIACVKVEHILSSRPLQDIQSQRSADDDMETQGFDAIPTYSETLPLIDVIRQKHINDSPISAITKKEEYGGTNQRNGSSAKERNAAKKRKKRAEKNRKLGVKRLKLQTVSKPKKIVYCRHYLQGRCHEGEKCKFSHDTTPLTKSKPCGHFARNSCMKGDDCPYDHQLSKYPCNNYTSTGFCSRGADCLFSHKILENQILSVTHNASKPDLKSEQPKGQEKAGSFTASIVSRPEVKLLPQLYKSNSSNSSDILTSNQKDDAKLFSPGKSGKSTAKFVAKPFSRSVTHAPKGVCFLTDSSRGKNSKLKLDETVLKSGDAVEVVHEANSEVPSSTDKLNETSNELTSSKPRGVNFLSFTQSSLDGSSFKTFSNRCSDGFEEAGKLVTGDLADRKQTHTSPKNGQFVEDCGQTSQNVTDLSWNLNGSANRTPAPITLHINPVSRDKNQSDGSSLGESDDNKDGTFSKSTEEKRTTPCKLPVNTHLLLPFGGSCDQSASARYPQSRSSSFKTSLLSNTPSLVQKAVQSTLALAAKFEFDIKPVHQPL